MRWDLRLSARPSACILHEGLSPVMKVVGNRSSDVTFKMNAGIDGDANACQCRISVSFHTQHVS